MSLRAAPSPWLVDIVTTSDALSHNSTNTQFVVPSGACVYCEMSALAHNSSTGSVYWIKQIALYRNQSGTLTQDVVNTLTSLGDSAMNTVTCTFGNSGTTIQPSIAGIASTTIVWFLDVQYFVN